MPILPMQLAPYETITRCSTGSRWWDLEVRQRVADRERGRVRKDPVDGDPRSDDGARGEPPAATDTDPHVDVEGSLEKRGPIDARRRAIELAGSPSADLRACSVALDCGQTEREAQADIERSLMKADPSVPGGVARPRLRFRVEVAAMKTLSKIALVFAAVGLAACSSSSSIGDGHGQGRHRQLGAAAGHQPAAVGRRAHDARYEPGQLRGRHLPGRPQAAREPRQGHLPLAPQACRSRSR